jgi:hypothetical protein
MARARSAPLVYATDTGRPWFGAGSAARQAGAGFNGRPAPGASGVPLG